MAPSWAHLLHDLMTYIITFYDFLDMDGMFEFFHVDAVGGDVEDGRQRVRQLHRELRPLFAEIGRKGSD